MREPRVELPRQRQKSSMELDWDLFCGVKELV